MFRGAFGEDGAVHIFYGHDVEIQVLFPTWRTEAEYGPATSHDPKSTAFQDMR